MSLNTSEDAAGFADLALRPELLHALAALGYEEPTRGDPAVAAGA